MANKETLFTQGLVPSLRRNPNVFLCAEAADNTADGVTLKVMFHITQEGRVIPAPSVKTSNVTGGGFKTESSKSKSTNRSKKPVETEVLYKHLLGAYCQVVDDSRSNRQERIVRYKTVYVTGIVTGSSTSIQIELFNNSYSFGETKTYLFGWNRIEENLLKNFLFNSVQLWSIFLNRDYKSYLIKGSELVLSIPQLTYPFRIMGLKPVNIKKIQEDLNYLKGNLISTSWTLEHLFCLNDSGTNKWILKDYHLCSSISITLNSLFVKLIDENNWESEQNLRLVKNYLKTLSCIVDLILFTIRVNDDSQ